MPSSVVASIQYNASSSTLRVTYVSGVVYDYKNVPEEVYAAMKIAFSKGTFLNQHIKGKYAYERSSNCFAKYYHESWKKLKLYYHIIGTFSRMIRHTLLNHLEKELGEMVLPDDKTKHLQGDEIINNTKYIDTDHINIEAPPSIVWHYLMQMGCDRAGWYSIDWLDHAGVKSTDHQVSKWGDRKVGDKISATPEGDSFFEVYQIEHENYFVIGGQIKK